MRRSRGSIMDDMIEQPAAGGDGGGRRSRGEGRVRQRGAHRAAAADQARRFPISCERSAFMRFWTRKVYSSSRRNADTVLEEIGIEFRDDAEALALWKEAGADVRGQRVHFPKGLCRELRKPRRRNSLWHARNSACNAACGWQGDDLRAGLRSAAFVRDLEGQPPLCRRSRISATL